MGYRAKDFAPLLDLTRIDAYRPRDFWETVYKEEGDRVVLAPGKFYLLLSDLVVPSASAWNKSIFTRLRFLV